MRARARAPSGGRAFVVGPERDGAFAVTLSCTGRARVVLGVLGCVGRRYLEFEHFVLDDGPHGSGGRDRDAKK